MQRIIVITKHAQSFSVQGGLISLYLSPSSWDKEETETKRAQTKSGFRTSDDRT